MDPENNYCQSREKVGYVPLKEATPETYQALGFKSGLEIHQQLATEKKLFCRCPSAQFQKHDDYDAELVRHMRPTLSELGEYDGTALMEFRTKKNIFYRIKDETACTYDIDDTPPFPLNRDALNSAMEAALLLKCSMVGELHITRKQYLDGSIPTGFQRTAIVGIDGEIPLKNKKVGIIQISLEEDSCREVSDIGHDRVYTTDRLGTPLIETVTEPVLLTPWEAEEAGHYLRFLARSTGKVNTGIGAARQDVNVSITGGTRIEIKGVQHIKWIPLLTHNEAFRQKALLQIKDELNARFKKPGAWKVSSADITGAVTGELPKKEDDRVTAVLLPGFGGLLSYFTSPGRTFSHELSDRLKVVACLEKPNITHTEHRKIYLSKQDWEHVFKLLPLGKKDAVLVFWGPEADIKTAIETVEERCRMAFEGVPSETRKSLANGTTLFERVLPGPDRMYPDTDSAPIAILEEQIEAIRQNLPVDVSVCVETLRKWKVPEDAHTYILRRNLFPALKTIADLKISARMAGTLLGHRLKNAEGRYGRVPDQRMIRLVQFVKESKLNVEILNEMTPLLAQFPDKEMADLLSLTGFKPMEKADILSEIKPLKKEFKKVGLSKDPAAQTRWIMGRLRAKALGNMSMKELRQAVEGGRHE